MTNNKRKGITKRTTRKTAGKTVKKTTKRKSNKRGRNFISSNLSTICIALAIAVVIFIAVLCFTAISTLTYDRVYDGVFLNKVSVSHMTKDELRDYINEKYSKPLDSIVIDIRSGDQHWELNAAELEISFNNEKIVDAIYNYGHSGNIFQRLSDINKIKSQGVDIDVWGSEDPSQSDLVTYKESVVDELAARIAQEAAQTVTSHTIDIGTDSVSVIAGNIGLTFDVNKIKVALLDSVNSFKSTNLNLLDSDLEIVTKTYPPKLDIDDCCTQINKSPIDASYTTSNNHRVLSTVTSQYGFSVDRSALEIIDNKLSSGDFTPGESFNVEITKIPPKVSSLDSSKVAFNDVLNQYTTNFSTSSYYKARNVNLKVGTAALDGYILVPGEQFSFNGYIGNTTGAKGYEPANGYQNGKLTPTYGGGICQVSTTLYNAVIRSINVDVDVRFQHSSKVGYVPEGLDCMINYNTNDFKFTNNTNYPIKIQGIFNSSGKLTFKILGTNEHKDMKYEFISVKVSETDYKTIETPDKDAAQNGIKGGKYTVTRVTYKNNQEIARIPNWTQSNYKAMNKYVYVSPTTPAPVTPVPPAPTPGGEDQPPVESPENPPVP